mmetsp:Transcript_23371/g.64736  ORF Transcript_23371/g.64736 Transcript_23371/m.64736 type:complete len:325 (-) Transcript_23371:899-1873(-)
MRPKSSEDGTSSEQSIAPQLVLGLFLLVSSFLQEVGNWLFRLARNLGQCGGALHVVGLVEESDRGAVGTRAARAAYAVHVGLHVPGHVEVDHVRNAPDVQAARTDVGGEEQPALPPGKLAQVALALPLRLVPVQSGHLEALLPEGLCVLVDSAFGVHEGDQLGALREVGNDPPQLHLLLVVANLEELLGNRPVRGQVLCLADIDVNMVLSQVAPCNALHGFRPRRREEQRLPVSPGLCDNLRNLRLETHVEHPVCLVENQEAGLLQRHRLHLHEVLQATGSRHENLRPKLLQGLQLRPLRCSPEDRKRLHFRAVLKLGAFGLDL